MERRQICLFLAVIGLFGFCQGRTFHTRAMVSEDRQRLYKCKGMDEKTCEMHNILMSELSQQVSIATGVPAERETGEGRPDYEALDSCIVLTVDQLDTILSDLDLLLNSSAPRGGLRRKRNLIDFKQQANSKWTMPLRYRFDGVHTEGERQVIRSAAQHWMDNTCVRFAEVPDNESPSYSHVLITNALTGCWSYVGRVNLGTPWQPLNLQDNCLWRFGTPVHELGHALGLYHEQMRADRDDWISVLWSNIVPSYADQFYSQFNTDPLGVPYDYSSVMQYSPLDGVSVNGKDSIVAKNPLFQMNMGQRTGLSFNDIRIMNKAYCADSCTGRPLPKPCQYGGYQNPNDCSRCHCPDGLSGDFCEKIAPPRNANCGGVINMVAESERVAVTSPGYNSQGFYTSYQECTWWYKAPKGYILKLRFDGVFAIYCQYSACYHWVEVKYRADIGLEGARFCCYNRPNVTVTSESNEMMVVFKSNFSIDAVNAQRGFTTIVTMEKDTSMPSAAAPKLPSGLVWQCSFEPSAPGDNHLCGMIQDGSDQFDWTVLSGPTPSDPTGPDFAADKDYYIFIEASNPRVENDEARISLPDLSANSPGLNCVQFSYHMFGFHVRELKFVEITKSSRQVNPLWSKKGEIDNNWYEASVNILLTSDKQFQFVAIRGAEYSGDIALDNIRIKTGKCSA